MEKAILKIKYPNIMNSPNQNLKNNKIDSNPNYVDTSKVIYNVILIKYKINRGKL